MRTLATIVSSLTSMALIGCATPDKDWSGLEAKVASAEEGELGTCISSAHRAGAALEEAKQGLALKEDGKASYDDYRDANAAADEAIEARRVAEEACNRIWSPGQAEFAALDTRLGELEEVREVLRGVTFRTGSAQLTTKAQTTLDLLANELLRNPDRRIEVAGHASATGNPERNMVLSQRRAESVRNYLVAKGVSSDRITPKGYGDTTPVASNETVEGRRANQRIEIRNLR